MVVTVLVERNNKKYSFDEKEFKTAKDILKELNESINAVIITINNEVVLEEYELEDGDDMKILSVVSGG
ncbi:MAG: MoaD/ThiS family protein [Nanoarchaeota archaeon]|nr:MoaD/ThiS family protein [Nanoarchaeota archaeon]